MIKRFIKLKTATAACLLVSGCASIGSDYDYREYETVFEDDDSCQAIYRDGDTLYFAGPQGFRIYAYNTDYNVFVKSEIEWRTKTIPYPIEPHRDWSQCDIQKVKDRMFRGGGINHDPTVRQVIDEETIRVITAVESDPEESILWLKNVWGSDRVNTLDEDLGTGYSLKYRGKALRENLPNAQGLVAVRSPEEQAEREARREALKRERAEKRKQRLQAERDARNRAKARWDKLSNAPIKRGHQVCTWDDNQFGFVEDVSEDRIKVSFRFVVNNQPDGFLYYDTEEAENFHPMRYQPPFETWVKRGQLNPCPSVSRN